MFKRKCAWCGEMMYFRPQDMIKMFCCKQCSNLYKEDLWAKDDGPKMPPLDASKISDEGYLALVNAIVGRAGQDVSKYKPNTQIHKDAKRFFESEYFNSLTGLDGQAVMRDLLKPVDKKKPELHDEKPKPKVNARKRRVRCIETGVVYDSITETAQTFGCHRSNIEEVCTGRQKTARGLHFEYVKEGK